jgi:hypothetical protein
VIKVKNNIKINNAIILCSLNVSIISHLGKNPKNGGNPPKDSKTINIEIFKAIFKFLTKKVWLIFKNLNLLNMKIILKDKKE